MVQFGLIRSSLMKNEAPSIMHHIRRNRTWIIIGLLEMWIGVVTMMRSQQLDLRMPPFLALFDDVPVGVAYFVIGALLVVNFVWDFYWYGIRVFLIVASTMMFALLFTSYLFNDLIHGGLTITTGVLGLFVLDILWASFDEPPHKLGKGG